MNKQELIKKYEAVECVVGIVSGKIILKTVLRDLKQLDEPEKVKVPQFVADFIAEQKKLGHTLSYSIDASMSDRIAEWYWDNSELFALSWIFGYEVEKEKRYLVKIKATKHYIAKDGIGFLKELIIKRLKVEYKENSRTVQKGILSKSIR